MDPVAAFAPPRIRRLAGSDVWVRPLTLGDYALLLAWLDDVLPGKADRKLAPKLWSDEAQKALDSSPGRCVLAHAVLRHQGHDFNETRRMASDASPLEWAAFLDAVFARRRTMKDSPSDGKDMAETWIGPSLHNLCEKFGGYTLESAARLTLDQYALLANEGAAEEDPSYVAEQEVGEIRRVAEMLKAGEDVVAYQPVHLSREYVDAMKARWDAMNAEKGGADGSGS